MTSYQIQKPRKTTHNPDKQIYLIANGDMQISASTNDACWVPQLEMKSESKKAVGHCGCKPKRAHQPLKAVRQGFLDLQKQRLQDCQKNDPVGPLIVTAPFGNAHIIFQRSDNSARSFR